MTAPQQYAQRSPRSVTGHHTVSAEELHRFRAMLERASGTEGGRSVQDGTALPLALLAAVAVRASGQLFADGPPATVALHGAQSIRLLRPVHAGEELVSECTIRSTKALANGVMTEVSVRLAVGAEAVAEAGSLLVHKAPGAAAPARPPAPDRRCPAQGPVSGISVDRELVREYAAVSGDHNPIHLSEGAALEAGFPGVIAHGMLTFALAEQHLRTGAGRVRPYELSLRFSRPLVIDGESAVLRMSDRPARGTGPDHESVSLTAADRDGTTVATGRAALRPRNEL
ncbi:MaoC/PaaZ C-terminal domain-containing protein [Streptomyces sanglieri]|uniref:MaoC/PaaZ C-terminal domain-containing protein n=2 Tax=Streptomyces TaxID=1883 RepID=A0ABW2X4C7_9ACTN